MTEMFRYRLKMLWHYGWFLFFLLAVLGPGVPVFMGLIASSNDTEALLGMLSGIFGCVVMGLGVRELVVGRPEHPSKKEVLPPSTYALDKLIADPTARMLDIVKEAEDRGITQFKKEHPNFKTAEELEADRAYNEKLAKQKAERHQRWLEQKKLEDEITRKSSYVEPIAVDGLFGKVLVEKSGASWPEHDWLDLTDWLNSDLPVYGCKRCGLRGSFKSKSRCTVKDFSKEKEMSLPDLHPVVPHTRSCFNHEWHMYGHSQKRGNLWVCRKCGSMEEGRKRHNWVELSDSTGSYHEWYCPDCGSMSWKPLDEPCELPPEF